MAFWYFGYGSNMDLTSLRAKGVEPLSSERAALPGWRLRFNVHHFFRHEGGVANVEPTGDPSDIVRGVLHRCRDEHLALLDAAEAYGHGYDRLEVPVATETDEHRAITYVGIPSFLDPECRPVQRYLNILVKGATAAGLDPAYIDALRRAPVHQRHPVPPFVPPRGSYPTYTAATLVQQPLFTALAGAVFDMAGARWQHKFLHGLFGGKDMTLFHLKRLDNSDGSETVDDIKHDRLTAEQRRYLNEYLHEYSAEYVYVGRYIYD
jgi:cation transport regulator ChaC